LEVQQQKEIIMHNKPDLRMKRGVRYDPSILQN